MKVCCIKLGVAVFPSFYGVDGSLLKSDCHKTCTIGPSEKTIWLDYE